MEQHQGMDPMADSPSAACDEAGGSPLIYQGPAATETLGPSDGPNCRGALKAFVVSAGRVRGGWPVLALDRRRPPLHLTTHSLRRAPAAAALAATALLLQELNEGKLVRAMDTGIRKWAAECLRRCRARRGGATQREVRY